MLCSPTVDSLGFLCLVWLCVRALVYEILVDSVYMRDLILLLDMRYNRGQEAYGVIWWLKYGAAIVTYLFHIPVQNKTLLYCKRIKYTF